MGDSARVCSEPVDGGTDIYSCPSSSADHLVVMVHGILGRYWTSFLDVTCLKPLGWVSEEKLGARGSVWVMACALGQSGVSCYPWGWFCSIPTELSSLTSILCSLKSLSWKAHARTLPETEGTPFLKKKRDHLALSFDMGESIAGIFWLFALRFFNFDVLSDILDFMMLFFLRFFQKKSLL